MKKKIPNQNQPGAFIIIELCMPTQQRTAKFDPAEVGVWAGGTKNRSSQVQVETPACYKCGLNLSEFGKASDLDLVGLIKNCHPPCDMS